jgi:hypothetical protein
MAFLVGGILYMFGLIRNLALSVRGVDWLALSQAYRPFLLPDPVGDRYT